MFPKKPQHAGASPWTAEARCRFPKASLLAAPDAAQPRLVPAEARLLGKLDFGSTPATLPGRIPQSATMNFITIASFLGFTGAVALLTWLITRRDNRVCSDGYFLGGRSLTFPFIAGSLLLTNLSTEQLVGLNGDAFRDGLAVMVWEVFAVVALVVMALFFLPRFLRAGITTVPEFLAQRFDNGTRAIANFIFLVAYTLILLPIILYTGATGMTGILGLDQVLGLSYPATIALIAAVVGVIGGIYAISGGLRSVAVSDTLNGAGLLTGGFLIVWFGLEAVGEGGGPLAGWANLRASHPDRFSPIGGPDSSVPFSTIFTGVILLHLFYWCTNQQIIQRTLGAKSLAEGQKGVLLTGALKLLGPLYLVIPGIIAWHLFGAEDLPSDQAYGRLVNQVLPAPLTGFFAAALLGAILSSFNSALNSTCTLFSLGLYKTAINPGADDLATIRAGRRFGWVVAVFAILAAPMLDSTGGIFPYLQKMNGLYFIPIFSVVLLGLLNRRVPPAAARAGLLAGVGLIGAAYFVPPFPRLLEDIHGFHFLGLVFVFLIGLMLLITKLRPLPTPWVAHDAGAVDLMPWRFARPAGAVLLLTVAGIYIFFAK
jgi:SSS family solute:Na+ symporter